MTGGCFSGFGFPPVATLETNETTMAQREIKFRAWHKGECFLIEWDFIVDDGILPYFSSDDYILMQYTGLKDKNGKEICEGDLLCNDSGRLCSVTWHNPSASWDATPISEEGTSYGYAPSRWSGCVQVVGNIHENPELLK